MKKNGRFMVGLVGVAAAVTYLIWFSLLARYAAGPLQAATAMTPMPSRMG